MLIRKPTLNSSQPISDGKGFMTQVFRSWALIVNNFLPIIGEGSPEGVVDAPQYSLYIDSLGGSGMIEYRKMLPDIAGNTRMGWIQV